MATARDNHPHTSLIAFAATPDLRHIIIATDRKTRKYAYLTDFVQSSSCALVRVRVTAYYVVSQFEDV
jgi:hypothetical protein